jgi:hypothetical protein
MDQIKLGDIKRAGGQLTEALNHYYRAYHTMARSKDLFEAELFTRAPLCLQELGREAEAWFELNRILEYGCPGKHRYHDPATMWLDRAAIYDKMRLFLQRAGKYDHAIGYGINFYVHRTIACCMSDNIGKPGTMRSRRAIESLLNPLLQKANKEPLLQPLAATLKNALKQAPDIDRRQLNSQVAALVFKDQVRQPDTLVFFPRPQPGFPITS